MRNAILCALLCTTCLLFAGCSSSANSTQESQEANQEAVSDSTQNEDANSDASKESENKASSTTPLFEFDLAQGEQSESVTVQENTNLQMEAEVTAGEATLTITEAGGYAAFSRSLSGEVFQTIDGLAPGTYTVTVSGDAEGIVAFSQVTAGK
ncbi:hypothetical protein [Denitrobacterium detoxificans]|jgi:hypothetical protein|uniref:hypothetical protein n=1 Tax=Denitrobacterium detoxificans TaxID=79604 RepID=UPI0026F11306|nr:hypothetical protein [Denitrobacterium detoxificans]MBE6465309.1 hypothetical protein [Denitrobacterium detoxificans]